MNQLDLILEIIRLGHIENLFQEAQSDLEVIRGQRLINESILAIRSALLQESIMVPNNTQKLVLGVGTGGLVEAGLGAMAGHEVGEHMGDTLNPVIHDKMIQELAKNPVENGSLIAKDLVQQPVATTETLVNPEPALGTGTGLLTGLGAGAGAGLYAGRRFIKRS